MKRNQVYRTLDQLSSSSDQEMQIYQPFQIIDQKIDKHGNIMYKVTWKNSNFDQAKWETQKLCNLLYPRLIFKFKNKLTHPKEQFLNFEEQSQPTQENTKAKKQFKKFPNSINQQKITTKVQSIQQSEHTVQEASKQIKMFAVLQQQKQFDMTTNSSQPNYKIYMKINEQNRKNIVQHENMNKIQKQLSQKISQYSENISQQIIDLNQHSKLKESQNQIQQKQQKNCIKNVCQQSNINIKGNDKNQQQQIINQPQFQPLFNFKSINFEKRIKPFQITNQQEQGQKILIFKEETQQKSKKLLQMQKSQQKNKIISQQFDRKQLANTFYHINIVDNQTFNQQESSFSNSKNSNLFSKLCPQPNSYQQKSNKTDKILYQNLKMEQTITQLITLSDNRNIQYQKNKLQSCQKKIKTRSIIKQLKSLKRQTQKKSYLVQNGKMIECIYIQEQQDLKELKFNKKLKKNQKIIKKQKKQKQFKQQYVLLSKNQNEQNNMKYLLIKQAKKQEEIVYQDYQILNDPNNVNIQQLQSFMIKEGLPSVIFKKRRNGQVVQHFLQNQYQKDDKILKQLYCLEQNSLSESKNKQKQCILLSPTKRQKCIRQWQKMNLIPGVFRQEIDSIKSQKQGESQQQKLQISKRSFKKPKMNIQQ